MAAEEAKDPFDLLAVCTDCATETGFPAMLLRLVFTEYCSILFDTQPKVYLWAKDESRGIEISNFEIYFFLVFV